MTVRVAFGKRRALLVSGGFTARLNAARFLNDLAFFYCCLLDHYGFAPADVRVVYANGGLRQLGTGRIVLTEPATKQNALAGLAHGLQGLGDEDLFVLFTTNHGKRDSLLLWQREELTAAELGAALGTNRMPYGLGIFGQCWSQSMVLPFLANTGPGKGVAVSASDRDSYALAPLELFDAFLCHFTTALCQQTPSTYRVHSDQNSDGEVDVAEAFQFVLQQPSYQLLRARYQENPHIEDNAGGQLACRLTLRGVL
jgi:hypothetical protein